MSIHVGIEHRTSYRFDRPVGLSPHVIRLRPAPHSRTPILAYSLRVTPAEHFVNWQQDPFGNYLARFVFPEKATEFTVTVDLVADMTVINPFDFFIDEESRSFPFTYDAGLKRDLAPYLVPGETGPLLDDWMAALPELPAGGMATVDFLVDINARVQRGVDYSIRMEPGVQTPDETLEKRLGSCRDSAWLLVQVLRRLGLAARFVSGYLVQLVADLKPVDGPSGPTADFTDLHAWTEVYVPGAGWIGMDPTSGLFAGEGHIPLACTPEPFSAAAITGMVDFAETTFEYTNVVRRIHEDPRVTLPYSPSQWEAIDALGHHVDDLLNEGDARLTMGGEPTFVSIDDMESPQWTTAADGPEKRVLAGETARRLAKRFADGGVLHYGQGKWYPGEPLPRWQIAVLWRTDGAPLWADPTVLADPSGPGTCTYEKARALSFAIAARLGIPDELCVPAYEDPLFALWTEARLPAGDPPKASVSPADLDMQGERERAAITRALDDGRGEPAGFAIPVHRVVRMAEVRDPAAAPTYGGWGTTKWTLRRGNLFLVPGDSPLGLRLPLDSLSWTPGPTEPDVSPFAERDALAEPEPEPEPAAASAGAPVPAAIVPASTAPTTALCVQVRNGHPYVFLPPLARLEDAVGLLAIVEAAARAAGASVVLEGYPLPRDPRVQALVVAPDPGVIEVNVHPAGSWDELVAITTTVHEEARLTRLGTETFQLDGSHSGTGGGNHITLGAAKAADSPLLRRPDLLRSLLTFWQHHPSLSYLFSGRFIGPTSQSPRVDEGRAESLYELEIAFNELERIDESVEEGKPRPWLIDRLLRHLLTDITGNTHRAEFCIDKLFSPDSERGRLGLLELRGFEMPPHPQMSLVQGLLVRTLVARFWKTPYKAPLVRWGTELHDRFLLPHFAAADVNDVVGDLQAHGFAFDPAWLTPFVEFRFPRLGTVQIGDVHLEVRGAIEPWHVLGEEVAATATARYVDSSVERLQVLVRGATEGRHVVTCNSVPVPLQPTGTPGEMVAGIRYKAWQPPSALHPTIKAHVPLVIDLVDRWNGRSLGGCTYHVAHPGGRNYDTFPVNANEAEARRRVRFETRGHTPGVIDIAALDVASQALMLDGAVRHEYPRTLDLRRVSPTSAARPR